MNKMTFDKKRTWAILKLNFMFIGTVLSICIVISIYTTILLKREYESIRQKGQPLSSAASLPQPVPASQNAAPLYQQAVAAMKFRRPRCQEELSENEITTILQQNVQAIRLVREAAAKPKCYFTLVKEDSDSLSPLPKFTKIRDLAQLLEMQAHREAQKGNSNAALEDVRRQFIMAKHAASVPTWTSTLSARGIQNTANRTLAKVLLEIPLTSSEAQTFETSLPQIDWDTYLHKVLLTERALGIETNKSFRDQLGGIKGGLTGFLISQWLKMDEVYSLRFWNEIIHNDSHAPMPIPSDHNKHIEDRIDEIPEYALSTKLFMPFYTRTRGLYDQSETQSRQRKIALALAVYRSKYQNYPATLQEAETFWESTFPLDPYNKKPFHYKRHSKIFLLYSIGPNGRDDGGIWKSQGFDKTIKDDLSWRNGAIGCKARKTPTSNAMKNQ